jgi:hypothetical protein
MVQYNGELYYPPLVLNGSNMKMFPTDVISLGAVLDCDWQGVPKIIQYMTETSYNIPPLIQEIDDEDNSVVTGMIEVGNLYTGLFFDINCTGVSFNARQAANIRRLSELYVDLPEVLTGATAPHATVTINEIYDTSDPVDSATSINRYVRDVFYQLNINGSQNPYYPIVDPAPLNTPSLGTSFEYDGNITNPTHHNGAAYTAFRNFKFPQGGFPDMGFQSWGNSYYMYFGLIPGKTGFDKLMSKYFTPCVRAVSDDFIIETSVTNTHANVSDGAIAFTFIGGTAPFNYEWTGTNFDSGPLSATTSGVISGLTQGIYTITAVDALGTVVVKNVNVDGPQPLICSFSIFQNPSTQSSTDGSVNINSIVGGQPPYSLNVSGTTTNLNFSNVSVANSPITNLSVGTYIFTVTDTSAVPETCQTTLELTSVPPLTFTLPMDKEDVSCNISCDGVLNPQLNGGTPPYSLHVTGPGSYVSGGTYLDVSFIDLCEGVYTITGTDSVSPVPQTVTTTVTLVKSQQPTINTSGINNSKQCNPASTTIKFNLVPGDQPFPYTIIYNIDGIDNTTTTSTAGLNTLVIITPINSSLTITVEDGTGCDSNIIAYLAIAIQRPATTLANGGNRVVNTITYAATGGIAPYSYTPVDMGQTNVYTAPSASPVIGVVTDSVGCTASASF